MTTERTDHADDGSEVAVRPAATVAFLRDGPDGPEVAMLRRRPDSGFVPDAYVFPGGALDDQDTVTDEAAVSGPGDAAWSATLGIERDGRAFALGAVRESFEEAGILLAEPAVPGATGSVPRPASGSIEWRDERESVENGDVEFLAFCADLGLRVTLDPLVYFGRWITPRGAPRRYDTRFFLAPMPAGQTISHDGTETVASVWIRPEDALARFARGAWELIVPTVRTLEVLSGHRCAADILTRAAAVSVPGRPATVIADRGGYRLDLPVMTSSRPVMTSARPVMTSARPSITPAQER